MLYHTLCQFINNSFIILRVTFVVSMKYYFIDIYHKIFYENVSNRVCQVVHVIIITAYVVPDAADMIRCQLIMCNSLCGEGISLVI
jgi:hypothetical protein